MTVLTANHLNPVPADPIVREASELGLKPGCFPQELAVAGVDFVRVLFARTNEGEVIAAHYVERGARAGVVVAECDGQHTEVPAQQLIVLND